MAGGYGGARLGGGSSNITEAGGSHEAGEAGAKAAEAAAGMLVVERQGWLERVSKGVNRRGAYSEEAAGG